MHTPQRLLLIASPLMRRTPVYDRAAALAKAKGMALHIVAFDYLEGLATAGLVNDQALAVMREGYVRQHREWLESQALSMRRRREDRVSWPIGTFKHSRALASHFSVPSW